ncbi:hypothetical protein [Leptolyngbya phage Lbo-JY46]
MESTKQIAEVSVCGSTIRVDYKDGTHEVLDIDDYRTPQQLQEVIEKALECREKTIDMESLIATRYNLDKNAEKSYSDLDRNMQIMCNVAQNKISQPERYLTVIKDAKERIAYLEVEMKNRKLT